MTGRLTGVGLGPRELGVLVQGMAERLDGRQERVGPGSIFSKARGAVKQRAGGIGRQWRKV